MTITDNTKVLRAKREAFARAIARGYEPQLASRLAGFSEAGCVSKRALKRQFMPQVIGMMTFIREEDSRNLTQVEPFILKLVDAALDAGKLGSAAGFSAMRALLAEAAKLQARVDAAAVFPPSAPEREMTEEEWLAAFAPKAAPLA